MEQSFIANDMPQRTLEASPADLFRSSLEEIIKSYPPEDKYGPDSCLGLLAGPTGVAYLFLQLSARHPGFQLQGHDLLHWAQCYAKGDRGTLALVDGECGVLAEGVSLDAVRACITKERRYVTALLENMPRILEPAAAGAATLSRPRWCTAGPGLCTCFAWYATGFQNALTCWMVL